MKPYYVLRKELTFHDGVIFQKQNHRGYQYL